MIDFFAQLWWRQPQANLTDSVVLLWDDSERDEVITLPVSVIHVPIDIATLHLKYSPARECDGPDWDRSAYLAQVDKFIPDEIVFHFPTQPDPEGAVRALYCNQHVYCRYDSLLPCYELIAYQERLGIVEARVEGYSVTLLRIAFDDQAL